MKLPLLNLPSVYHVGTLNPADRGVQHPESYEGAWLSASLCPQAWQTIARLGGQPVWCLCKPDAFYLDVFALEPDQRSEIVHWAQAGGWIEPSDVFETRYFDDEADAWRRVLSATREEAEEELDGSGEVNPVQIWTLTQAGRERAKQGKSLQSADDFALQFWLEDVVACERPEIVGLYWDELYDPLGYSAPRAAIMPGAIDGLTRAEVECRYLDDDEDLLGLIPRARWIAPEDLSSPYTFVTDCVSANGDSINCMTDDVACRDLTYEQFTDAIGTGAQALMDRIFPEYRKTESMGLTLGSDRCVTFHESSYEGVPCVYVQHSAIEYVFQRKALVAAKEVDTEAQNFSDHIQRPGQ